MDDTSTAALESHDQQEVSPQRARQRARVAARHTALTVLVPIQPERLEDLSRVLTELGRNIRRNPHIRLSALKSTHFLRWVIVPAPPAEDGHGEGSPTLAFEANFDGSVGEFLDDLIRVAGDTLKANLYCHCSPPLRSWFPNAVLKNYLLDHALPEALFYQGYPGVSVESIDNDARVRELINAFLAAPREAPARLMRMAKRHVSLPWLSRWREESQLHAEIREYLEAVVHRESKRPGDKAGAVPRLDSQPVPWKTRLLRTTLVRTGLGALVMPVAIPTTLALLGLELAEGVKAALDGESETSRASYRVEDRENLSLLLEREDLQTQNQLTHLADLKPGALRLPLVKLALWVWGYLATYYFTEGELGGIQGIHFARWVLIEDEVEGTQGPRKKHRLLFFSNYDGSWEEYLGAFVDRASIGLTSIWCNTEGFPRTRLRAWPLRLELGAEREESFKQWVRHHQVYTQAWFSRNPDKSASNILNNREIRSRVKARMSSKQVKDWLRRL
jgi:hypothetical protein